MIHNRAYHKFKDQVKKNRKIQIVKHTWRSSEDILINSRFLGKLIKGKVHCSCPMCNGAFKRKVAGPRISELRRLKDFED